MTCVPNGRNIPHDPGRGQTCIGVVRPLPGVEVVCGFLKKVDSVNVTLLLILRYVDFLSFSPVRG